MKKQFIFSLLLAMTGVLFAGCEKTPDGGAFFLNSNVLLEFPGEGGSQDISFFSCYAWSATSSADWCTVSPQSGFGGSAKITVTVKEGVYSSRRATITISANGRQKTVAVNQPGLIPTVEIPKTPKDGFWMGTNTENKGGHNYYAQGRPNELPVHQVKLSAFNMGITEVTNAQYATFLNEAKIAYSEDVDFWIPEDTKHKGCTGDVTVGGVTATYPLLYDCTSIWNGNYRWGITNKDGQWVPMTGYENHPVINVTWYGAKAFCDWLSTETGQTWRLPTEAEWEYACRAGEEGPWFFGSIKADLGDYAWFSDDSGEGGVEKTHAVRQLKANGYGLYDMYGNVAEWCESYVTKSYSQEDMANPDTKKRAIRGANWGNGADFCRSAYRDGDELGNAFLNLGFRVVLVP